MTTAVWHAIPHSLALAFVLGASCFAAQAACPTWPTAQRFLLNGSEVTDTRTGLVWARCSAGQSWSGTSCTGRVTTMTHESALTYANAESGWRLPSVKELSSLADKGCRNPAIDTTAFPATPAEPVLFWTSSPRTYSITTAWTVNFYDGSVVSRGRDPIGNQVVRLVRTSQ